MEYCGSSHAVDKVPANLKLPPTSHLIKMLSALWWDGMLYSLEFVSCCSLKPCTGPSASSPSLLLPTWHLPSSSHLIQIRSSLWALAHQQPLCLLEMMALLAGCPPLEDWVWRHICEGLFQRHACNLQRTVAGAATEWRADAMTPILCLSSKHTHTFLLWPSHARLSYLPPIWILKSMGCCVSVCLLLVSCSLQKSVASCSPQNSSDEFITFPHANRKNCSLPMNTAN